MHIIYCLYHPRSRKENSIVLKLLTLEKTARLIELQLPVTTGTAYAGFYCNTLVFQIAIQHDLQQSH